MAKQNVPNPDNLPNVNHKDGNKEHFSQMNLEWCTPQQNTQHAVDTGLINKQICKGKEIELLDENYNVINIFYSMINAADNVGRSSSTLHRYFANKLQNDGTILVNNHILRKKIFEDLANEIWKPLNTEHEYVNIHYTVSNYARIKNVDTNHIFSTI